jgi:hypothetical protein
MRKQGGVIMRKKWGRGGVIIRKQGGVIMRGQISEKTPFCTACLVH